MASQRFGELLGEIESGEVTGGTIPEGVYDVVVTGARPLATSSMVFLTVQVLNGPMQGKDSDVSLYFPTDDAKRGARVFFHKKFAGFAADPGVVAALKSAADAADEEAGFQAIADSLVGKTVAATIGIQKGNTQYAGSNELRETKPLAGAPASNGAANVGTVTNEAPVQAAPVVAADQTAKVPF